MGSQDEFETVIDRVAALAKKRARNLDQLPTIASRENVDSALLKMPRELPEHGYGLFSTSHLLFDTILPSLAEGQAGPRYFGFVIGGVTPPAQIADWLAGLYDTNASFSLANETTSAYIEGLVLKQILSLLSLPHGQFAGRALTSCATTANILGLTVAREYAVRQVKRRQGVPDWSVAEDGMDGIAVNIYCAGAHASLIKAASVVGLGRKSIKELAKPTIDEPCAFDLDELEAALKDDQRQGKASIVAASIGEINTGGITPHFPAIRKLCDRYDTFFHVDAAFGSFAALHPDFAYLSEWMALADSITSDGHKWLNLPYDCGIFFCRDQGLLFQICGPGQTPAAYLSSGTVAEEEPCSITAELQSRREEAAHTKPPMYLGLDNSRRFRALPAYASLTSLGRQGYAELVQRNITFARAVADWISKSRDYDLLLPSSGGFQIMNIVLFAPSPQCRNTRLTQSDGGQELVRRIKASRKVYATPTSWLGRSAARFAISNWSTTIERDLPIVIDVLQAVLL